jgi:ABC-type uncharacterized transport system ATPase subunit
MGPNGSGKSTLASLIRGHINPQKGTITGSAKDSVGLVHQHPQAIHSMVLWKTMVASNQAFKHSLQSPGIIKNKINQAMEGLNIHLDINRNHSDLSRPEAQLAQLVEITMEAPLLIIFDEPDFSGIDRLNQLLKELKSRGKAIILITHQWEEAKRCCDRLVFLKEGSITQNYAMENTMAPVKVSFKENRHSLINLSSLCKEGLDLQLHRGDRLVILGYRESGLKKFEVQFKSLLYQLDYSYIPSEGKKIALDISSSLRDNIAMEHKQPRRGWRYIKKEKTDTAEWLKLGGWHQSTEDTLDTLSGGNQQKLLLRREGLRSSDVLVAAHPTLGLDQVIRDECFEMMKQWKNKALLYLTSEPLEALGIANPLALYFQGEITAVLHPPYPDIQHIQQWMMGAKE